MERQRPAGETSDEEKGTGRGFDRAREQEGKRAAARATAIWKLDERDSASVRERAARSVKEGETFPLRASSSTSR